MAERQTKPVVLDTIAYGKNWTVHNCKAPGLGYILVSIHNSRLEEAKVDPKTKELDLPAEAVYSLQGPPQEYFAMGLKGVISLFEKK